MRIRPNVSVVAAVLLLGVTAACGQSQPSASRRAGDVSTSVFQAASPNSPATPITEATSTQSSASPEGTPELAGSFDTDLARRALDQVRATKIVKSGTPKVVLSRLAPAGALSQLLGFAFTNYAPSCDYRIGLVILKGDFDLEGYAPGFDRPLPSKYIALPYDPSYGFFGIMGSPNGSEFKHALNDPSLPDPPTPAASPVGTPAATPATPTGTPDWHYWPCPAATPGSTKP